MSLIFTSPIFLQSSEFSCFDKFYGVIDVIKLVNCNKGVPFLYAGKCDIVFLRYLFNTIELELVVSNKQLIDPNNEIESRKVSSA